MKRKSALDSVYIQGILLLAGIFLCLVALNDFATYGIEGLFKVSTRSGRFNITSFTGLLIGIVLVYFSAKNCLRILKRKNRKK